MNHVSERGKKSFIYGHIVFFFQLPHLCKLCVCIGCGGWVVRRGLGISLYPCFALTFFNNFFFSLAYGMSICVRDDEVFHIFFVRNDAAAIRGCAA